MDAATARIPSMVPTAPSPSSITSSLSGRLVAFTTPLAYSGRLSCLLSLRSAEPLPIPTISVDPIPSTLLRDVILSPAGGIQASPLLEGFAGVAFTSRTGILAISKALDPYKDIISPSSCKTFTLAALGKDADLLYGDQGLAAKIGGGNLHCIRVLVPEVSSPAGMVKALGFGAGMKILCPVPNVLDLTEPPVVPNFLHDLEVAGWIPVRVSAYETRWMGPKCMEVLADLEKDLDAIVFTSTAEVEGMIKGLEKLGWDWKMVRMRWPKMIVAAHGPVTAKGAESYGVCVDVVSKSFSSFDGVLDAMDLQWSSSN